MGFIENERRRKAAELEAQRKSQSMREQQERELIKREASEEATIRARAAQSRQQSKQQFEQSGLGGMITELGKIGSHKEVVASNKWSKGVNHVVTIKLTDFAGGSLNKRVEIKTAADGTINIQGGLFGSTTIPKDKWQGKNGQEALEKALEKAYKHPLVEVRPSSRAGSSLGRRPPSDGPINAGPCLPGNSLISTPNGFMLIKDIRVGDFVWTSDRFGRRVQTVIVKKAKRIVSKNHTVVHIVLEDGRELVVSLGHPTIDYRQIGSLVKGDNLDMSYVASIKVMPYKGKYTYDILPYGKTGGYWANNILIGSTLFSQFQKTILDGFRLLQVNGVDFTS